MPNREPNVTYLTGNAYDDDDAFFKANPGRRYRLRKPKGAEILLSHGPMPPGAVRGILVRSFAPSIGISTLVPVPDGGIDVLGQHEELLAFMWLFHERRSPQLAAAVLEAAVAASDDILDAVAPAPTLGKTLVKLMTETMAAAVA